MEINARQLIFRNLFYHIFELQRFKGNGKGTQLYNSYSSTALARYLRTIITKEKLIISKYW